MNKAEMIEDIEMIIKANKDNKYCSVYYLANMIIDIVDSPDLKEKNKDDNTNT